MYLFPSTHDSQATLGKVPSVVLERWASGSVVEHNVFGAPVIEDGTSSINASRVFARRYKGPNH